MSRSTRLARTVRRAVERQLALCQQWTGIPATQIATGGATNARTGEEIKCVREGSGVDTLFRETMHFRHFPGVIVHGAAD